jgi:uncharacterized protein involved in exopolysaccharide biosynthesis
MSTDPSDVPGEATNPPARFRRAGWLLLWLVGSALACWAIYVRFPPLYRAESILRMGPTSTSGSLFGSLAADQPPIDRFIETQMSLILTDQVLAMVVANPGIADLPMLRNSTDKVQIARSRLRVSHPPGTAMVYVSAESEDPEEAAKIVNAVIEVYLRSYNDRSANRGAASVRRIKESIDNIHNEIQVKYHEMAKESAAGAAALAPMKEGEDPNKPGPGIGVRAPGEEPDAPTSFRSLDGEQYRKAADRLFQADLDLIEARAQPADAAGREARIASLKALRAELRGLLAEPKLAPIPDPARIEALKRDIDVLTRRRDVLTERYEDLRFAGSSGLEGVEVNLVDVARAPSAPTADGRAVYMALASFAMLVVVASAALVGGARRPGGEGSSPSP